MKRGKKMIKHKKELLFNDIDKLSFWQLGNLSRDIYLIKNDVRPVAEIKVFNPILPGCITDIEKEKLLYETKGINQEYSIVYVFKYEHLRNVINKSIDRCYSKDIFDMWVDGKMFGYSESAIAEYIKSAKIK
jgi:hypothetical protein